MTYSLFSLSKNFFFFFVPFGKDVDSQIAVAYCVNDERHRCLLFE